VGTLNQAEKANEKLQKVYGDYAREDSLNTIRHQNSEYYAYFLQSTDETFIRESIVKKFERYGFGFADERIEVALSNYLYRDNHYSYNPATDWLIKQHKADSEHVAVGVVFPRIAGKHDSQGRFDIP